MLAEGTNFFNYFFDINTHQVLGINGKRITSKLRFGYQEFIIYQNRKQHKLKLHRILYQHHNPTIDVSKYDIIHIDNNKDNNDIANLTHKLK